MNEKEIDLTRDEEVKETKKVEFDIASISLRADEINHQPKVSIDPLSQGTLLDDTKEKEIFTLEEVDEYNTILDGLSDEEVDHLLALEADDALGKNDQATIITDLSSMQKKPEDKKVEVTVAPFEVEKPESVEEILSKRVLVLEAEIKTRIAGKDKAEKNAAEWQEYAEAKDERNNEVEKVLRNQLKDQEDSYKKEISDKEDMLTHLGKANNKSKFLNRIIAIICLLCLGTMIFGYFFIKKSLIPEIESNRTSITTLRQKLTDTEKKFEDTVTKSDYDSMVEERNQALIEKDKAVTVIAALQKRLNKKSTIVKPVRNEANTDKPVIPPKKAVSNVPARNSAVKNNPPKVTQKMVKRQKPSKRYIVPKQKSILDVL